MSAYTASSLFASKNAIDITESHAHTYVHAYVHAYIHAYTHAYTHTYTDIGAEFMK